MQEKLFFLREIAAQLAEMNEKSGIAVGHSSEEIEGRELLTTQQAASILGTTVGTLNVWRCEKRYPLAYIKIGANVRYRRSDITKFINARKRGAS